MTSKFREIIPPFPRQGYCIPSAATDGLNLGLQGADECPLMAISGHPEGSSRTSALPPKQTLVAQERVELKKRTLDVRFTPNSGHKWVIEFMSAYDP